jgi:hypothetical protein
VKNLTFPKKVCHACPARQHDTKCGCQRSRSAAVHARMKAHHSLSMTVRTAGQRLFMVHDD